MTQTPRHSEPMGGPLLPAPTPGTVGPHTGDLGARAGLPVAERAAAGHEDGQPTASAHLTRGQLRDLLRAVIDEHSFQGISYSDAAACALLAAGWRPRAQVIEDSAILDALPVGAIVMDAPYPEGEVYQRTSDGLWAEPGFQGMCTTRVLSLPATVLWSPPDAKGEQ
jgi:hypothetical protein